MTRDNNFMKQQGVTTRLNILKAGLKLWPDVTASSIANELGITHAAVLYHFPNVKDTVADYAVEVGDSVVIVQLLLANHKSVKDMTGSERLKHFSAIS